MSKPIAFSMSESMLFVPLRWTERINIGEGIRKSIASEYNQHPDQFATDIDTIDRLREHIVSPRNELESLQAHFL
jgi:hypothetical protein